MRPPPTLVPRGLRLGDAALARAPWRREPRQAERQTEQTASTEDAGRRRPGRPRKTEPNAHEAASVEIEDTEMLDIPAEEGRDGQDVDMGLVGSLEPARDDFIGQILLQQMGAGRSYVREKRQAVKRILISEIYSPPRITKEIAKGRWKHLAPGFALDLTVDDPADGMPWDFSLSGKRKKAVALVR